MVRGRASASGGRLTSRIRFPRAIIGGELQYLSVTGVERFDPATPYGCPRAWGFRTIDRVVVVEDRTARDAGEATHKKIDHYQVTGEDVLDPVARAGKHFIYPPGPGLLVEYEALDDIKIAGVPFYVRLDVLNSREYWLDDGGERRPLVGAVEVNDWKTTGSISDRALSGRGLLGTVQMPVYGLWSRTRYDFPEVRLSHSYFGTRKREALKVSMLATRQEIDDRVGAIARVVETMKEAARASTGAELEPDYTKCDKTRAGCPYKAVCPRPASMQMAGLYGLTLTGAQARPMLPDGGDNTMAANVLDLLKMKKTEPAASAAASAPAANPAPPAVDQAAVAARVAELEAELARARAATATPAPNVTLTGEDAAKVLGEKLPPGSAGVITSAAIAAAAGVAPPDAPVSGTTGPKAEPISPEQLAAMPAAIQKAAAEVAVEPPPAAATGPKVSEVTRVQSIDAEGTLMVPPTPAPEAPAKKTRSKKADGGIIVSDPAKADGGIILTKDGRVEGGVIIAVDSVASGVRLEPLDSYVEALLSQLCEHQKILDVRCAPDDSMLAYGKWKGVVRAMAKAGPPSAGAYSLHVGGDEVRAEIVRGLQSAPGVIVVWGAR